MTSRPIIAQIVALRQRKQRRQQRNLHSLALDEAQLPDLCVSRRLPCAICAYWDRFPERDLNAGRPMQPVPYAALAAACMIKIDQRLATISALCRYLVEHPALVWLCGFRLVRSKFHSWGFDADSSLPTKRHLTRMLRTAPNRVFQFLLDSGVALIEAELAAEGVRLGASISLDTKHILAWVKENNPKAYATDGRYDKKRRLKGDPDRCLGCKRCSNQRGMSQEALTTPDREPEPASQMAVGEFYWGYASGVVATKAPGQGEFVLAELTQTFDRSDVTYFFPLMAAVEARLGRKPRLGRPDDHLATGPFPAV